MLDEDGEEVCVAPGKGLLDVVGQAVDVGVGASRGRGRNVGGVAASGARQHIDIELADGDFHAERGEGIDRVFLLLEGGPVERVVALQAHGGDFHSGRLQVLDQIDRTFALGFVLNGVVVVIELAVGVGLVGILEGFYQIVLADDVQPLRFAQRAVFIESFVDNVPASDFAFVAGDDGGDVLLHARKQRVAGERRAFVVLEDPAGDLAMPYQVVSDDEHLVLLAEGNVLVGRSEIVGVHPGMDHFPLHDVFGADGIELRADDPGGAGIFLFELALIDRRADAEEALKGVFQGRLLGQSGGGENGAKGNQFSEHSFLPNIKMLGTGELPPALG
ncbi:hypothetical protein SBA3_880047 [Candidatus Sulfopaludibacter sp. SbA3]|nr:hypothetical protein SBA3_880047 [Candidatus Sulfopaludibacter sp. SbA3]